ncbi:MAG: NlpC/P60 family protein [Coriobacteriia bacterium]|nr:NlpC/P60 family protein [Coriobacteriia bacterium]
MSVFAKKRSLTAAACVLVCAAVLLLPVAALSTPDAPRTAAIDNSRARATAARIRLDELALQLELASENYFAAEEQLALTVAAIAETEKQLQRNQEQLDEASDLLSERAVGAYQTGELSLLAFVFDANNLSDMLARLSLLRTIMENDANLIVEVRSLRADIESNKAQLEEDQRREQEITAEKQAEYDAVQQVLAQQQSLLATLDAELQRLIAEERAHIEAERIRQAEAEARRLAQIQRSQEQNRSNTAARGGSSNTAAPGPGSNSGSAGGTTPGGNSGGGGSGSITTPPTGNPINLGAARPAVVTEARRFIGVTPYLWGGTTPAGFDCSGLTQWCYRVAYGINLPRTSRQQFHAGVFIPPGRRDLMQPGDLLFYSTTGRPEDIHHVAIFIGNSRMIHAPMTGRMVEEAAAFRSDFIGAVRP